MAAVPVIGMSSSEIEFRGVNIRAATVFIARIAWASAVTIVDRRIARWLWIGAIADPVVAFRTSPARRLSDRRRRHRR